MSSREQVDDQVKGYQQQKYVQKQHGLPPNLAPSPQAATYPQQPQGNPYSLPDAEEDQYERKGDYYQCVRCEKYTVHVANDKYCHNPECPSNAKRSTAYRQATN